MMCFDMLPGWMVEKNEFGSKTSDQPSPGPEEQKSALNRSGLVNKKNLDR